MCRLNEPNFCCNTLICIPETDYRMSETLYEEKFSYYLARDLKVQFIHDRDVKFRFGPAKYQFFHTHLPVVMKVLNKAENAPLKEFLFGEQNPDFEFTPEFLEAKAEFNMFHALQVSRTEKVDNSEFESFLTTCENAYMYALGIEDGRCPLRDPYRSWVQVMFKIYVYAINRLFLIQQSSYLIDWSRKNNFF